MIAANVEELHGDKARIDKETALTERLDRVNGVGDTPNARDILTGSRPDGTAYPPEANLTCNNWTSNGGDHRAHVGHHDRRGLAEGVDSWNSADASRGCSQSDLEATGGAGLFYCFAIDWARAAAVAALASTARPEWTLPRCCAPDGFARRARIHRETPSLRQGAANARIRAVRRFALAVIVGLLTFSASGAYSLVLNEPCTGYEAPGSDDAACPPTCLTCGCCAQAVEPVAFVTPATPDVPIADNPEVFPGILSTTPRDVLHVPKLRFA